MMNGVDAVAFTDGMIEDVPNIRKKSCEDLSFPGIETDGERNEKCTGKE